MCSSVLPRQVAIMTTFTIVFGSILLGGVSGQTVAPRSFIFSFMNITPDTTEQGFIQIYAVTTNVSTILFESTDAGSAQTISGPQETFFNGTFNYDDLAVISAADVGDQKLNGQDGLILSASNEVHVYGIKSDRGSTDGFKAIPLTTNSKEFYIAAWNCTDMFFAAVQIVSAIKDTCVEIYQLLDGEFQGKLKSDIYLENKHHSHMLTCGENSDITGYFINSTKPIAVYAGHSCAFVPEGVFYCDHIVEQIPPVSELGLTHIVPPIVGRDANAGYVVRVVATQKNTVIDWETMNGGITGSKTITRGEFHHLHNTLASQAMRIVCSKPCLVMLYNTGRNAVNSRPDPVPTDPFMMMVAPEERFEDNAGLATANFCQISNGVQYRIDFVNYVAIVTKSTDKDKIFLDNAQISTWTSTSWGYSYTTMPVKHGMHTITVALGFTAKFGAYVYGHSQITTSSSAYGYTVGYKVAGELLTTVWQDAQKAIAHNEAQTRSADCAQERIYSGLAVALFPSAANPYTLKYPFTLSRTINSSPMTINCREQYRKALAADLLEVSRRINYLICNQTMCPYVTGSPGSGVRVNESTASVFPSHVVHVAIDTASLTDPIAFDVTDTGSITTVKVTVPYVGITTTTAETYSQCRAEVRQYLTDFVNWPRSTTLFPTLSGCPAITIAAPYEYTLAQSVCPA